MLVWGGCNGRDVCFNSLSSGAALDPATNTWTALPQNADTPAARVHHTAVWAGDRMLVWGGESGYQNPGTSLVALGDGGVFVPPSTWQPLRTDGAPSPRARHTAVWTGRQMLVWGGCDRRGIRSEDQCRDPKGDGRIYDAAAGEWRPMATDRNTPTPRYGHTAVWTDRFMVVWGGTSRAGVENTGAIYDPERDEWLPMASFRRARGTRPSGPATR
jgi:hypothetical protein